MQKTKNNKVEDVKPVTVRDLQPKKDVKGGEVSHPDFKFTKPIDISSPK